MNIEKIPEMFRLSGGALLKRGMDLGFAAAGIFLLAPFFLLVWILIRLDSPGPGFYCSPRVGQHGKLFGMYKFRTMVVAADQIGPAITVNDDPRITRLGKWLRERRLDEFPQLFNVIRGEMSLVGPRPETAEYVRLYTAEQLQVLTVKPGVTGPMQIAYLDEESRLADETTLADAYVTHIMPAKLAIEQQYLERQSCWYDIGILLRTVWALRPGLQRGRHGATGK